MDLRTKLLLGIGLALVITFTLVAAFSVISMQASYRALENYEVQHAVATTQNAIRTDMENTFSTARDYSAWTATYNFAQGDNPGWVDENMGADFFSRFTMDHILIFDRTGRLIFSSEYNATSGEVEPVPEDLVDEIRTLSRERKLLSGENGTYGIIDTTNGPLLIASHVILTDNYGGPPAGSLHLGRQIDESYLADLSAREGYDVSVVSREDLQGNVSLNGMASLLSASSAGTVPVVLPDDESRISGYAPINDLSGTGNSFLRVTVPRTIYHAGQANIVTFVISLSFAGIFITFFVLLFVDRIILSRINAITRAVRERRAAGMIAGAPVQNGGDELTNLATAIDPVFSQLAASREQLSESEERYRTLAESARDIIFIIDRDDRVAYVNEFAARSIRRPREELIGKPRSALFPGPEGERQHKNIERVIFSGQPVKIESVIPLPEGESWQDTLLVPVRDRDGTITGVMGISRDITQRRLAEEALQASNERFRTVMDSLDTLVYVADIRTCEILFLNQKGIRVWGDITGKLCWKTIQEGQDGPCPFCNNDKLLDAEGNPAGVIVWEHRNRINGRWYECRDRAIRWIDGRFVRLEIATDITERKRAEEALSKVNEKLNLLSSITRHDILNQLTALSAYLNLSLEYVSNDTLRDYIAREQQIAATIDREISFTRDYQELGVKAPVWHDVAGTIAAARNALSPERAEVSIGFSGIRVFADPLLEKVFFNLIDNAVRYGGENLSMIRFSVQESGGNLIITCEDNGAGVPPADKTHIFERGFGHHTGLGLFLSREILGITNITITETGTFGQGARFEIVVPEGMFRVTGGDRAD